MSYRQYYLTGTIDYITTANEAKRIAASTTFAVVRQHSNDNTYTVYFLSPLPIQPGQVPFDICHSERMELFQS